MRKIKEVRKVRRYDIVSSSVINHEQVQRNFIKYTKNRYQNNNTISSFSNVI